MLPRTSLDSIFDRTRLSDTRDPRMSTHVHTATACESRTCKSPEIESRGLSANREEKCNETKVIEKYCWAITPAVGRSYCGRLGSEGVGVTIQLDPPPFFFLWLDSP
jgi:hypothetical protein